MKGAPARFKRREDRYEIPARRVGQHVYVPLVKLLWLKLLFNQQAAEATSLTPPVRLPRQAFKKGHIIHIANYHANHSLQMLINSKQRIISCVLAECSFR